MLVFNSLSCTVVTMEIAFVVAKDEFVSTGRVMGCTVGYGATLVVLLYCDVVVKTSGELVGLRWELQKY